MRWKHKILEKRYPLLVICIVPIAIIVRWLLDPELERSDGSIVLLMFTAAASVIAVLANLRNLLEGDGTRIQAHKVEYDSPQHESQHRRVLVRIRSIIENDLREKLHNQSLPNRALSNRIDVSIRVKGQGREYRFNSGSSRSIASIYHDSAESLLILGPPGSGKTVTLLELAIGLLERAAADVRQPIPVVLHLSKWAERQEPLDEWVISETNRYYKQISKSLIQTWLNSDHLCLLLDGLDEVRRDARAACVEAVNL